MQIKELIKAKTVKFIGGFCIQIQSLIFKS